MMVNCPRCGFSQEKDQYCAKCGVDMIAFQPARKPFLERLVKNIGFQLCLLALIVIAVFSFARRQHHRELAERLAELESARTTTQLIPRRTANVNAKGDFATIESSQSPAPQTTPTPAPPPSQAVTPTTTSAGAAVPLSPTTDPNKSGEGVGSGSRIASSARIVFASIGKSAMTDLIGSADQRSLLVQGPIISGVVSNLAAKMKSVQVAEGYAMLDQSTRPIKLNQVVEFYGGQRDDNGGQFLGFVMELTPTQIEEADTHLQLRAWRYLRDPSVQIEEFSIPLPESFNIPNGGGAFILSALPKRQLSEAERHFYEPMKVLSLLSSDDYRSGATDLVIFIEPR